SVLPWVSTWTNMRSRESLAGRRPPRHVACVSDPAVLLRIRHLVIPPAWTDVWICPDPKGHVQATGRDARGRKQYLYHPRWREVRDAAKYERLAAFGEALPNIRERVERHLGLPVGALDEVVDELGPLLDDAAGGERMSPPVRQVECIGDRNQMHDEPLSGERRSEQQRRAARMERVGDQQGRRQSMRLHDGGIPRGLF